MRILDAKIFWNLYPMQKPCNIHAYSVIIHATKPRLRKSRICMVMHDDVWICMDTSDNYLSPPLPSTCRCHRRRPLSLQHPLATLSPGSSESRQHRVCRGTASPISESRLQLQASNISVVSAHNICHWEHDCSFSTTIAPQSFHTGMFKLRTS